MDAIQRIPAILIVDDDELVRTLLFRLVTAFFENKQMGFTCQQAGDSDVALSILEENQFDLIFMDVQMPGHMDGVGLIQVVRANEKGNGRIPSKIICITGNHTQEEGERAMRAGANRCMFKPFAIQNVFALLAEKFGR